MKKIGIVAAVVVSTFVIGWQAKTSKVVEANEFRLVDPAGKLRGKLTLSKLQFSDLKTEVWREIAAKGLPLRKDFSPPPDAGKVRIAVLDLSTGRTGSISVPLRRAE